MPTKVHPAVVRAICQKSNSQIAQAIGIPIRTLQKWIADGWGAWRVALADKFCSCCGLDFWRLEVTEEQMARVRWSYPDRKIHVALKMHLAANKMPTTKAAIAKFAAQLDDALDRRKEARCGSHH